jgi:hypothetical protein
VGVDSAPPDTAPPYPDGPYGLTEGATFPDMRLEGYRDGTGEWIEIRLSDYYDPNGDRGINAILLNASAAWCPICNQLARELPTLDARFRPRGAKLIELLVDAPSTDPAIRKTIDDWQKKYALPVDTVIDPRQDWLSHGTPDFVFPTQWYIDPRTMTIVRRVNSGPDGSSVAGTIAAQLDLLLTANGAPGADAGVDARTD